MGMVRGALQGHRSLLLLALGLYAVGHSQGSKYDMETVDHRRTAHGLAKRGLVAIETRSPRIEDPVNVLRRHIRVRIAVPHA